MVYNNTSITCAGGLAGLVLCLYAKMHKYCIEKKERKEEKELLDIVRQNCPFLTLSDWYCSIY